MEGEHFAKGFCVISMGTFQVEVGIGNPQGQHYEYVEALVDSGSTYNILPASLLRRLDIEVQGSGTFRLADGRRVEREMGETRIRLNGEDFTAPVVFGTDDVQPLLGAVTLEIFRLAIDPVDMRLIPVDGLMMAAGVTTASE